MATLILKLDPSKLANPDTELRLRLADLLCVRTGGLVEDDGFNYTDDNPPGMLLFFETNEPARAAAMVIESLKHDRVMGNDLSAVPVAVRDSVGLRVVHPPGFRGTFEVPDA
jgi:hypothetical protein